MDRTEALRDMCDTFSLEYSKWEHYGKDEIEFERLLLLSLDLYDSLMRFLQYNRINVWSMEK